MQFGPRIASSPGPDVTEPYRRQQAKVGRFWCAVHNFDSDEDVLALRLGVLHEHIEVTVLLEYAGVEQFEFGLSLVPTLIFFEQLLIRERPLRILVQILHVGVSRSTVEIKVIFLY